MSVYSTLVSELMFPLHERLKGHSTMAAHRELERTQWLSGEELRVLQLRKLRDFLGSIGTHVPYYRELFKAHKFVPASLESLADLARLPLLDKATIRANAEAMRAENAGELARFNTGGSSGEPLVFYLGKDRVSHDVAAKRRATRWWGVDIGDRELVVWGSPVELGSQDRIRECRDRLFRSELLPAFEMSQPNLNRFVNKICTFKPRMLFGYPSSIAAIAGHAQKMGRPMSDLGVKVVFVTSERLYDEQRELIERVFDCPVANGYGGRDAGFIAHECPEGSMHISAEDMIVEIVDKEGRPLSPGNSGEIVVTHMHTREYPFVRYRTGDVGTLDGSVCECGRGLPVLRNIDGRTTDFVAAADGTVMHGLALIYVLRDLDCVGEFRIEQESLLKTTVQLVPVTAIDAGSRDHIVSELKKRLGAEVEIELVEVEEIAREASGKFRYVKSRVTGS